MKYRMEIDVEIDATSVEEADAICDRVTASIRELPGVCGADWQTCTPHTGRIPAPMH
jgi:hypothetical protein